MIKIVLSPMSALLEFRFQRDLTGTILKETIRVCSPEIPTLNPKTFVLVAEIPLNMLMYYE